MKDRSVRIGAKCGVTLPVTSDPPSFVKYEFWHERIAPDDSPTTIKKYERMVFEACEEIVEKRVRKLRRIIKAVK